jgi:hypothetical protein
MLSQQAYIQTGQGRPIPDIHHARSSQWRCWESGVAWNNLTLSWFLSSLFIFSPLLSVFLQFFLFLVYSFTYFLPFFPCEALHLQFHGYVCILGDQLAGCLNNHGEGMWERGRYDECLDLISERRANISAQQGKRLHRQNHFVFIHSLPGITSNYYYT